MTALATVLLSNIFVACVLALVATFVGWSGRRAVLAHWLWLAVFLKLITPPLVHLPVPIPDQWSGHMREVSSVLSAPRISLMNLPTTSSRLPAGQDPIAGDDQRVASGSGETNDDKPYRSTPVAHKRGLSLYDLVLATWCLGCVGLLLRGAQRYRRMVQLLHRESIGDEQAQQRVRELLQRDEPTFVPGVRLISARISPMLFGIGRSTTIVCPRELWLRLDEPQRASFLAHECAHFQRRDHWVRWVEWFVTSVFWWLPLVYWARRQLERHEEVACDAAALKMLERGTQARVRRSYAESLLGVVDFLSESDTRAPRLASRMQPTAAIEERLLWIMTGRPSGSALDRTPWLLHGVPVCLSLMLHPTMQPRSYVGTSTELTGSSSKTFAEVPTPDVEHGSARIDAAVHAVPLRDLPPAPTGWWNQPADTVWADRELGEKHLRLLAQSGIGIGVSQPGGQSTTFDTRDVSGLAFVAESGRLVVARKNGELHLWDAASARSVSLIGKHSTAITSTSWSPLGGLISSDQNGTIVRWEMQSGQMLASKTCDQPVSAVRWSEDGKEIGALTGNWSLAQQQRWLILFNGESLKEQKRIAVPNNAAVMHHDTESGWLLITWSGQLLRLDSGENIGTIPKHEVSGAVLCAELLDSKQLGL